MLKKIGLGLLGVVVVLCSIVAAQPATYTVTRSAIIAAPPEVVFPFTNDFHKWVEWSPWDKMEPGQQRTHSGAPAGVGAVYEWSGKEVGKGRMTLTESVPPQRVAIRLEFLEPMASVAMTGFTLAPAPGGTTQVTWAMEGRHDFLGKAFGLVMNLDAMVGKDFESGLASLKALAEAEAKKAPAAVAAPAQP